MKNIDYKKVIFSIIFLCIAAIGVMAFFVIYMANAVNVAFFR